MDHVVFEYIWMSGGNFIQNWMKSLCSLEFETLLRNKVRKEKRRKEKQGLPADRAVPSVDWAEATQHWE